METWLTENRWVVIFAAGSLSVFALHCYWLRRLKAPPAGLFTWLVGIILIVIGCVAARQAGNQERAQIAAGTEAFARLYGHELEELGHWRLPDNVATNAPEYLALIEQQKQWQRLNPEISDIYTLRRNSAGQAFFLVDAETDYDRDGRFVEEREQRTPVGEVYDAEDPGADLAFDGTPNFITIPITDRWGTWVSAFVPMRDPSGRVEAIVGVDFDAHRFAMAMRNAQLRVLGLFGIALVVLLGSSILNSVLRAQIAERQRTEESLRLLGSAVQQARESVVITDAQLELPGPRIVFVNPAFTVLTGYAEEEVLGKTPRILQGPRTDQTVRKRMKEKLQRGEPFHGEAVNYRKDGSEFLIEWDIAPIRDSKGTVTHYVSIQRDMTDRKQMEDRLIQSQKLEVVARVAGGISHEFNNILMAIIGHSDLMSRKVKPDEPAAKHIEVIRKAAERATALTRQLMASGQRQILHPEKVNLNLVLTGMEPVIRHLTGKNIEVRIETDADLYPILADAGQIGQVVTNMVLNAHDAMPNGGTVSLVTSNAVVDSDASEAVPELKPGEYAVLAISDTGAGMTAEVRARAFEPFFSTKDFGKGGGLALATCYGIIKQSNGHITVDSVPGKGTTFKIYMPRLKE